MHKSLVWGPTFCVSLSLSVSLCARVFRLAGRPAECVERSLAGLPGLHHHGSANLPEEPLHPAAADGLRVRRERPHHQLHPALHLCPLALQQAAVPPDQLPALLFSLEP